MIPNELNLCFMGTKDYFNAIYGVLCKYIHLFILDLIELFRILWNIFGIIMKKSVSNHMMNGTMDQKHQIMMKYQSEKIFMALYIRIKMILFALLLNSTWGIYDIAKYNYHRIYIKIHMNEMIKYWFRTEHMPTPIHPIKQRNSNKDNI